MLIKPMIVGEAPSKDGDVRPIDGRIGQRLAQCAGQTMEEFRATFVRINLLDVRQEHSGKGAGFNFAAARIHAKFLRELFRPEMTVILLGKRVALAFGMMDDYFLEHVISGAKVYVVPHPSGVNRWYNDPANRARMCEFMHGIVNGLAS